MKVRSGVTGLDPLLDGGFAPGTVNILAGPAGSGKTLFGLHFALASADEASGRTMLLTLEDRRQDMLRAAKAFSLDLAGPVESGRIELVDLGGLRSGSAPKEEVQMGLASLPTILGFIEEAHEQTRIDRLVLDSLAALRIYYREPEVWRAELFRFIRSLRDLGLTALLLSEPLTAQSETQGVEPFLADSYLLLGYENISGEYRRTITVYKMRYTRHDPYKHPFLMTKNGMVVDPDEVLY